MIQFRLGREWGIGDDSELLSYDCVELEVWFNKCNIFIMHDVVNARVSVIAYGDVKVRGAQTRFHRIDSERVRMMVFDYEFSEFPKMNISRGSSFVEISLWNASTEE